MNRTLLIVTARVAEAMEVLMVIVTCHHHSSTTIRSNTTPEVALRNHGGIYHHVRVMAVQAELSLGEEGEGVVVVEAVEAAIGVDKRGNHHGTLE